MLSPGAFPSSFMVSRGDARVHKVMPDMSPTGPPCIRGVVFVTLAETPPIA